MYTVSQIGRDRYHTDKQNRQTDRQAGQNAMTKREHTLRGARAKNNSWRRRRRKRAEEVDEGWEGKWESRHLVLCIDPFLIDLYGKPSFSMKKKAICPTHDRFLMRS